MSRWLHVRIEFLGNFIVFAAITPVVLNVDKSDPSLVSLALSFALNMVEYINFPVRTISKVQNQLISVEHIKEHSKKPTEVPLVTDVLLLESWPMVEGAVLKDRRGLDPIIKDVSFIVEPAEMEWVNMLNMFAYSIAECRDTH